jgi:hypothetical protein
LAEYFAGDSAQLDQDFQSKQSLALPGSTSALPSLFPVPGVSIMVAAFAAVVPFFFLGNPSGHDFEFHLFSWMEVVYQWKEGILYPRWASLAHWGYGEARFLFYPPASWNLGAVLGAFLPWKVASGAYVWIALSASGFSMFLLARRWLGRNDAIFAAVLYALNPYHMVIVYWRSALAELLAGCLLPLLLLFILRAEQEGRRMVLPLSLIVATAWLTNAPSAMMVNYSLALLVLTVAIMRRNARVLLYGAAAVLLGAALAGFYLIPAAYEEKWVDLGEVLAPGVRPLDNFLFTNINDADHNRFNLLVSTIGAAEILVLGAAGFLSRSWRREKPLLWWALGAWAGGAILLMCPFTFVFWEHLPKLRFVQLPWRWLLCLNVAFALLVTVACRRWATRVVLCGVLLGLVWTVWHRVQQPWWDTAADIEEMHDAIVDGGGYEGTDEYVPAGVDPYELNKDASPVTVISGARARIEIVEWRPQTKVFSAEVLRPEKLRLRLFDYPAWLVEVNGSKVVTEVQDVTGEIVVPVPAGANLVRVTFIRTPDRLVGDIISLLALLVAIVWAIQQMRVLSG